MVKKRIDDFCNYNDDLMDEIIDASIKAHKESGNSDVSREDVERLFNKYNINLEEEGFTLDEFMQYGLNQK